MARVASGSVARSIESLFERGSLAGVTDRQLLEQYTASGREAAGEAAFAALVARHGPMVLGVCRQLLGDAAACRGHVSGRVSRAGSAGEFDPRS